MRSHGKRKKEKTPLACNTAAAQECGRRAWMCERRHVGSASALWLHPPFFSIVLLHCGQSCVLALSQLYVSLSSLHFFSHCFTVGQLTGACASCWHSEQKWWRCAGWRREHRKHARVSWSRERPPRLPPTALSALAADPQVGQPRAEKQGEQARRLVDGRGCAVVSARAFMHIHARAWRGRHAPLRSRRTCSWRLSCPPPARSWASGTRPYVRCRLRKTSAKSIGGERPPRAHKGPE